jgi:putative ABC transport system ATP-binding protein
VDLMLALWKRRGMTLVVVTHDTQVARKAPRSAIINHGALSLRNNLRGQVAPAAEGQAVPGGVAD